MNMLRKNQTTNNEDFFYIDPTNEQIELGEIVNFLSQEFPPFIMAETLAPVTGENYLTLFNHIACGIVCGVNEFNSYHQIPSVFHASGTELVDFTAVQQKIIEELRETNMKLKGKEKHASLVHFEFADYVRNRRKDLVTP